MAVIEEDNITSDEKSKKSVELAENNELAKKNDEKINDIKNLDIFTPK